MSLYEANEIMFVSQFWLFYLLGRKLKVKSTCMRIVNFSYRQTGFIYESIFYIYDNIASEISRNFALGLRCFLPCFTVQKRFKASNGS